MGIGLLSDVFEKSASSFRLGRKWIIPQIVLKSLKKTSIINLNGIIKFPNVNVFKFRCKRNLIIMRY